MSELNKGIFSRRLAFTTNGDFSFISHRLPFAYQAQKMGYEVFVIAPDTGKRSIIEAKGFKFIALPSFKNRNSIHSQIAQLLWLFWVYFKYQPDVIHHSSIGMCFVGSIAALILPKCIVINGFTGLGFIFSFDSRSSTLKFRFAKVIAGFVWNRPNVVPLFQNQDDYETLSRHGLCNSTPKFISGSGVDTDKFIPRSKQKHCSTLIVGCAARLVADKGFDQLLDAMELVSKVDANIVLSIAGNIDESNPSSLTSDQVDKWRSRNNIRIHGFVDDVVDFWNGCDIAILLSKREGLPKSLIEAASCGLPIIATDVPGCREIVRHNFNGYLVDPRSVASAANAIISLAEDETKRKTAGARSREMVLNGGFSKNSVQLQYSDLLTEVTSYNESSIADC